MSAQSHRSNGQNTSRGGEVVELKSPHRFASSFYESIFRENINAHIRAIDEIQAQAQQYQYSAQTSLQLARTLLSSNEILLHSSESAVQLITTEISSGRESMARFVLEGLVSNVDQSQQKTDAIMDLYNSILNLAKCATKLNKSASLCVSRILDHHHLANEISLNEGKSGEHSKIHEFIDYSSMLWERASKSAAAAHGVTNGILVLAQNALDVHSLSKSVTDRLAAMSNNAAQLGGMN